LSAEEAAKRPLTVAIISAEASGDRAGAGLAAELKRLRPNIALWGTGGKYLREAGADVVIDSSRWGVIGAASALAILPRILAARRKLMAELKRRPPDVLVPIDAGAFHLGFGPIEGLCSWARRELPLTKILYYFPPGSWRRTLKRTTLAGVTDAVATPFPWSETELRRLGVNARFVGHPLLDLVKPSLPFADFAARYGLDGDRPVVGLLPGSRRQEISEILPVQLEAAAIIHRRVPGVQFLLALAPTVDRNDIIRAVEALRRRHGKTASDLFRHVAERLRSEADGDNRPKTVAVPQMVTPQGTLHNAPPGRDDFAARTRQQLAESSQGRASGDFALTIVEDATYDVMSASDVLLTASGTATLEAAILGKPMVIMYRFAVWHAPEYWIVKKSIPKYVGLPNLLANRRVVPEYLQNDATPDALAGEIIGYLLEPARLLKAREELQSVVALLGTPGGAARAAAMVLELGNGGALDASGEPSPVPNGKTRTA